MNLKKGLLYIVIGFIITMIGCKNTDIVNDKLSGNSKEKITIAVSIVPQETFVKAVAGDLVEVVTMIPPGNSPANYQPTPKEMTSLSKSEIYFAIEVPTEKENILDKIEEFNKDIKVVSLSDKVAAVYPDLNFHEDKDDHHDGRDPHIWLSPKRVKVMVEVIKDELIDIDRENKQIYEKNAEKYISDLDKLDKEIEESLKNIEQKAFIIYHPSFGYFADDYGLEMITIEKDGKDTTAQNLQNVIEFAKEKNIKYIFYQEEFDSIQAETVAKEIEGKTIKIAPLAPNYIENLRNIAMNFKDIK